jgi:hypothetical protein
LETEPRPTLPEHGLAVLEKDSESNSSAETIKAVAITEMAVDEPSTNDAVPDALVPEAYVIQPSSPAFSWIATPASTIDFLCFDTELAGKSDMTYGNVAHDEIPQIDQIGLEHLVWHD